MASVSTSAVFSVAGAPRVVRRTSPARKVLKGRHDAHRSQRCVLPVLHSGRVRPARIFSVRVAAEEPKTSKDGEPNLSETAKKYGLEAGLFKALTDRSKDKVTKAADAKTLLKQYGSAYLITSVSFAIVSYAICYFLVDQGVDVASLLSKVGITTSSTSEKVGTAAIAYAAHKAASPIRFPPTVALTPVVAKLIGKEAKEEEEEA